MSTVMMITHLSRLAAKVSVALFGLVCVTFASSSNAATGNTAAASYALTVGATGNGTVNSSPNGIICGSTCTTSFPSSTVVTLWVSPASGWDFAGWGGACSGMGTCTLTMSAAQNVSAAFTKSSAPPPGTEFQDCPTCPVMVVIPAGSFLMGQDSGASAIETPQELPQHRVTIGKTFAMSKYPVSQAEYLSVVGNNPSQFRGDQSRPVEMITLWDTNNFATIISARTKQSYWLPSEAIWEYAARGGSQSPWFFSNSIKAGDCTTPTALALVDYAWMACNAGGSTHPVGQKKANPFGLYDVYGNVMQRVWDCLSSTYADAPTDGSVNHTNCYGAAGVVVRGGNYLSAAADTRSGYRTNGYRGEIPYNNVGFRIARSFATTTVSYSLTVTPTGSGSVTSNTGGITCGSTCSASFNSGTSVTLTATPAAGWTFSSWGGACSGTKTPSCSVTMDAVKTVTVTFAAPTFALTVTKAGAGTGTVNSILPGIACGSTCSGSFPTGTSVTLHPIADSNSIFTGWSGACTNSTGDCTVLMNAAKSVTATFAPSFVLTVTKTGTGTGTVTSPAGINCGSTCSMAFPVGTKVDLTAAAGPNSTFIIWGGVCTGKNTCTVTMSGNMAVSANFALPVRLTVNKAGAGIGTVTSNPTGINCGSSCTTAFASFTSGASVTLTATADAGSKFTGWTGGCGNSTGTCTPSLNADNTVTATFAPPPPVAASQTLQTIMNQPINNIDLTIGATGGPATAYVPGEKFVPPDPNSLTRHGQVSGDYATNVSFNPTVNFHGDAGFYFQLINAGGNSNTAAIHIVTVVAPPVPAPYIPAKTNVGQPVTFNLADGYDRTGDPANGAGLVSGTQIVNSMNVLDSMNVIRGSVTISGTYATFTPAAGFTGAVSFPFVLKNAAGNSPTASPAKAAVSIGIQTEKPEEKCSNFPCPIMIDIPAGYFTMGQDQGAANWERPDENKPRKVTIKGFAISAYPVTVKEYQSLVSPNSPSSSLYPITNISWADAKNYAALLSAKTGKAYRLPTEAEWEYAARGSTQTPWFFSYDVRAPGGDCTASSGILALDQFAWTCRNASSQSHLVGKLNPNPFGLYDIYGNVYQWVQDCYNPNYTGAPSDGSAVDSSNCLKRVIRGGSFAQSDLLFMQRSSSRNSTAPTSKSSYIGFRVAKTLQ